MLQYVIGVIMLACTISHTCTVFVGRDRDSDSDSDRETEIVDHGDALGLELLQRHLFAGTRGQLQLIDLSGAADRAVDSFYRGLSPARGICSVHATSRQHYL